MERRSRFWAMSDKRDAVEKAEKDGLIADSGEVRLALMQRVYNKEITLEQAQEELKKIKKNAKKNGLITKSQAFNRG